MVTRLTMSRLPHPSKVTFTHRKGSWDHPACPLQINRAIARLNFPLLGRFLDIPKRSSKLLKLDEPSTNWIDDFPAHSCWIRPLKCPRACGHEGYSTQLVMSCDLFDIVVFLLSRLPFAFQLTPAVFIGFSTIKERLYLGVELRQGLKTKPRSG